jgi:crotonobetaine/carnitine-CoA ligase
VLDEVHLPPHAVARWAAETPGTVALQEVGGRSLTYAELHEAALTWADAFERHDVTAGTHVATFLPSRIEAQLAMLGLAWVGAVEVPLNAAHRGELLRQALERSESTAVVVDASLLAALAEVSAEVPALRLVVVVGGEGDADAARSAAVPGGTEVVALGEFLAGAGPDPRHRGPVADDVAALLFTSGTTGPSKAVIAPWGLIYSIWSWIPDDAIAPGEGLYCSLPMFHNSGRSGFTNCVDRGGRFVFREKFSVTNFWDDVRATDCRIAALVGPLTSLLWSAPPRPDDADNPLRGVILGPMIPAMAEFEERFGVKAATCYGQTESGCPITTGWDHGPWANCGGPRTSWPYNEVRLVDEHGVEVPVGEIGEMVVRSPERCALNLGYHNDPGATAEAWRGGWFHTGDLFRRDAEGWHYFVDRARDSIRRRGENISSFEVEAVLNAHPDAVEVAVIGVRTEHGDDEVFAAVQVADPASFDPAAFHAWAAERLPRFMVPRYVEAFADLPRNRTTSRVLKADLRARGVGPATWDATTA